MTEFVTVENLSALLTLTLMEIVLGIDNIIFIAILVAKLPKANRTKARVLGILLALIFRIIFLFSLTWIMGLSEPLFKLFGNGFTGRDLILIAGGLFLVGKSTVEIQEKMRETNEHSENLPKTKVIHRLNQAIFQIMLIDLIFSVDSVVTAVGMAQTLAVMISAVIASMLIMMWLSGPISNFVEKNPTIKILALAFLILIGVSLIIDGTGGHVAKGYIYFAMAFSLVVEFINLRLRKPHPKG
jgi:predicted tellurium resistance membrane protein TerC